VTLRAQASCAYRGPQIVADRPSSSVVRTFNPTDGERHQLGSRIDQRIDEVKMALDA